MFKKNKKIIFQEGNDAAKFILDIPKPSTNNVPTWYRNQKLFSNNQNKMIKAFKSWNKDIGTFKLCVPLVDSVTSGYQLVTPCDILVTNSAKEGYSPYMEWGIKWDPVDIQDDRTLGNFPIPVGHNSTSFRWSADWIIKTPYGYSTWITHPAQRYDLPFTTLTAFVDTDKHPNKLFLPFFIKDNFVGIIPEGTPIAQLIPIKRESWISEKKDRNVSTDFILDNIVKTNFIRTYKNKFWTRKEYK